MKMSTTLFLLFSIFLQGALGEIVCEDLDVGTCSFSIASSGKRCLLETYYYASTTSNGGGGTDDHLGGYQCKTSEVVAKNMPEWVESEECINACGVDRYSVGISSDSLLDPQFTSRLCAPACFHNCPNIVDLYYNLALGEGVFLPGLCKAQQTNPRRELSQFLSSGAASGPISAAAAGPVSAAAEAPASSESLACPPSSI